jgi:hypothetical protein
VIIIRHSHRVGYDKIHGRRRGGQQLDEPNGQPWPVELADKVTRWDRLQHTLSLPSNQGDPETMNRRTLAGRAQRFALGLPATASEAEVAAFTAPDLATARALAAACIDIYDRLKAGDQSADILATISPVDGGEPDWRMPTGEPTDRRADQLKPGDIIAGCWDRDFAGRRLVTSFTGPVEQVSAVVDRHERGRWVTVQLLDGSQRSYQTHVWFSVFPDAYPH